MANHTHRLLRFACVMAQKLDEKDHKVGWKQCSHAYLVRRLREETGELAKLIVDNDIGVSDGGSRRPSKAVATAIQREAADVANFAFMIADNVS